MKQRRLKMPVVELEGNADLRRALRRFAPDLEKALRMEMKKALSPIAKQARGFVPATSPLSGWADRSFNEGSFPTYSASTIKSKIGYTTSVGKKNSKGFSSMASIYNNSRAGAIYEGAGRANPNGQPWVGPKGPAGHKYSHSRNPKAGEQFINALPPLTGSLKGRGRLIFRAWAANQGKAEGAVMKAISTASEQLQARSKSGTLRKAA
jgi:hypothetical protein